MLAETSEQLLSIARWLLVIFFLQIVIYPNLKPIFKKYAFPTALMLSLLIFTCITWYLGLLRLPIYLALLPFIIILLYNIKSRKIFTQDRVNSITQELKNNFRWIAIFVVFFSAILLIKFMEPEMDLISEQLMDYMMMQTIVRNPIVPPLDPWLAGGVLNVYYYIGYWMFACIAIVSSVPMNYAFNLCMPTIFGVCAVNLYMIGDLTFKRFKWLPLGILFMVPPSLFWSISFYYRLGHTHPIEWFWFSTRVIGDTITEYPIFSVLWGDVHPHIIALMNQSFYLFILAFAYSKWGELTKKQQWILSLAASLSLATIPVTNTWDIFIYAPITIMFMILIWDKYRPSDLKPILAIPPIGILIYLPFIAMAKMNNTRGFMPIFPHMTTEPFWFLLFNGFFIFIFYTFTIKDMIKKPKYLLIPLAISLIGYQSAAIAIAPLIYMVLKNDKDDIPTMFGIIGLLTITFCEFVYIRDGSLEKYFRLNTVFKFYMISWSLMGISIMSIISRAIRNKKFINNDDKMFKIGMILFTCFIAISMIGTISLNHNGNLINLNNDMEINYPNISSALKYLHNTSLDTIMVSSTGDDFSLNATLSTLSGVPTVIGMPYHEYLWRGWDQWLLQARIDDVHTLYTHPETAQSIMKKYNATIVIVSVKEDIGYNTTLNETNSGLIKLFDENNVKIYGLPQQ